MRIAIEIDGTRETVDLRSWEPGATLAQLIESAGNILPGDDEPFYVDSNRVTGGTPLEDVLLLEGSLISRARPRPMQRIPSWNVSISGGVAAGSILPVPPHRALVIGRSPQADITLPTESASWNHCTVELVEDGVRIRDAGSTNGTIVNGEEIDDDGVVITEDATAVVGGAVLSIRPGLDESPAPAPGVLRNLTPASTSPFNRPPRPGQPAPPEALAPPVPRDVPAATRFSLITVAAPIAMAIAMVLVLQNPRFALFALLSPVMAIGMWFEQRRRRAKNLEEEAERFAAALAEFQREVAAAAELEKARRQAMTPDPAIVMRRPLLPSTSLWQRRHDAPDFLNLYAGVGDVPWTPEIDRRGISRLDDRVKDVLDASHLDTAPVVIDANDAGVIGVVGDREGVLALARSLVIQAAVHCGPADLTIGVFCDQGREGDWEWASWLPHTRQAGSSEGVRWMSNRRETSAGMLRGLLDGLDGLPAPALFAVIDSEVLTEGRDSPARQLLGTGRPKPGVHIHREGPTRQVAGIVIARSADQLPAACTTVIEVGRDASAVVFRPEDLTRIDDVILSGIGIDDADTCARALAHFDDPELVVPGASLPSLVRLPELLDVDAMTPETIRSLWSSSPGISTPVGLGEDGPLSLDLVRDGPHGLVGGTTGSGKSEFLRSFVAGLAARNDPTMLNFILIDFKGGAAFRACERLPHTIGTISNLDAQLADRALRALEAEMERRQRLFAQAGEDIDNLPAYLATRPAEPLPRLLLVIDEFAMLAKDFPDVLASLVSVAAVGRTLGVHMILATQRPAGVVNEDILANTNLRVALRVQSREDSSSVIGVPSAAAISRTQQGRAYVKLGQDEIIPVQTALVTGRAKAASAERMDLRGVGLFGVPLPPRSAPKATDENDLDLLIDAVVAANASAGYAPPRQVWPEALSERVSLSCGEVAGSGRAPGQRAVPEVGGVHNGVVHVALVDEPDLQRQSAVGWDLDEGNLFLIGIPGSGTSSTLASIALSLARDVSPDDLDILCLDMGSRGLSPLADLPHTVAYVGAGPGARERQVRFLRHLRGELRRRRETPGPHRVSVVLIDGLAALRDEFEDYEGQQMLDALYRAYADGPALGLHFAVSTTRVRAIPSAMDEVTTQRWIFRLADAYDYSALGIKGKTVPAPLPGRCVDTTALLQMHIATPDRGLESAVAGAAERWADAEAKPDAIGTLPDDVPAAAVLSSLDLSAEPLLLPVGVREDSLVPAVLEVYEGEHVLIAGPARSGKSTLLCAIAEMLNSLPGDRRPALFGVYGRRSPLAAIAFDQAAGGADEIPALLASLRLEGGPAFLLVDDAERVDDTDQSLQSLLNAPPPGLCVVAAGRSEDLRGLYSHWTKTLRKSRCGVLLQPDVDYDGDLLGVRLPRTAPVVLTQGRGYACSGGALALIQSIST